jgi:hypothetical protein
LSTAPNRSCENCGGALLGPYCHHCGAPDLTSRDRSLRSVLADLSEAFTSVEHSKLLRTLRELLFRPGVLTKEYFTARRVRYIRPLALCLTMLALHLFAYSVSNSVTMFNIGKTAAASDSFLRSRGMDTSNSISVKIGREAARENVSVATVEGRINDRWARNVSLFQIPLIVLFAAVLQLAYLRSGKFVVEHFTFSTHYISFQVLFQVLMWPFYYYAGTDLTAATVLVSVTTNAISLLYLFAAVRTFYGDSMQKALIRAPLLYVGYFIVYSLTYQASMLLALRSTLG